MVIRVLDHKYFVLRTIDPDDGLKQYVCRDLVNENSNIFRIVRIPHADVTPKLLRYLADIEVEGSFRELCEYASEGDFLCIVMDCGSGSAMPLSERLVEEEPKIREKLEYVYKLVERLILSNVPAYFAAAALTSARVKFTPALDCSFDFDVHDILDYESYGMNDVCTSLADVMMDVFDVELRWNSMPELNEFVKNLQLRRYSDYLDIFGDFKEIAQKYSDSDDADAESNSFPFRLWDVIKSFASQLRNLSALLLLILAVIYLVISIRNHLKPTAAQDVYSSIGDMQIVGTGSSPENSSGAEEASDSGTAENVIVDAEGQTAEASSNDAAGQTVEVSGSDAAEAAGSTQEVQGGDRP